MTGEIRLIPVRGIGELRSGDDLGELICSAFPALRDGDIVVVSSKAVSKTEGRVFCEEDLVPSAFARQLSETTGSSPAYCELVLRESAGILRVARGVVICRTHHGFVMANAGVDASNTGGDGLLVALPVDPDASARRLRARLEALSGARLGVIVSDTFGRAWRDGQTNLAIGLSGAAPLRDYRGARDNDGRALHKTCIAAADELAAAAELASGKTGRVPAVVVRGYDGLGDGSASDLLMDPQRDLFP